MASFARDVTKPINIPEVRGVNFSNNKSTAQDVVDVASLGLQVFDRVQATNKETARQQKLSDLNSQVDRLMSVYVEAEGQVGGPAAMRTVNKKILDMSDPDASGFLLKEVASRVRELGAGGAFSSSKKESKSVFDLLDSEDQINVLISTVGDKPKETWTPEESEAVSNRAIEVSTAKVNAQNTLQNAQNKTALTKENLTEVVGAMRTLLDQKTSPMLHEYFKITKDIGKMDPSQQPQAYEQSRRNVLEVTNGLRLAINSQLGSLPASEDTERESKRFEKQIDNLESLVTSSDFNEAEANARALEFMTGKLKLDVMKSGNLLFHAKQTYGVDFTDLLNNKLAEGQGKTIFEKMEDVIETELFGDAVTEAQRKAFTYEKFMDYTSGKGSIDDVGSIFSEKDRATLYQEAFSIQEDNFKSGKVFDGSPEMREDLVGSVTHILADGNKENAHTALRVVDFLSHPNTQRALEEVESKNPERVKAIKNMAISYSRTHLTNPSDGTLATLNNSSIKGITFDVNKKMFVIPPPEVRRPTAGGMRGDIASAVRTSGFNSATKAATQANRAIEVFFENKASNPALAGLSDSQALNWLLTKGSGVSLGENISVVNGKFEPLPEQAEEAISQQVSLEELSKIKEETLKRASTESQLSEMGKQLQRVNSVLRQLQSGEIKAEDIKGIDFEAEEAKPETSKAKSGLENSPHREALESNPETKAMFEKLSPEAQSEINSLSPEAIRAMVTKATLGELRDGSA